MANISNINDFFVVDSVSLKAAVGADLANSHGTPYVGTDFTVVGKDASNPVANLWLSNFTHKSYILVSDNSSNFIIKDSGAGNRLTIDTNGNSTFAGDVNIGNGAAAAKKLIIDCSNPVFALKETDQSADSRVWGMQSIASKLYFRAFNDAFSAATDVLILDRSGNVGIGVTPPSTVLLDLKEADTGSDLIIGLTAGTGARAQIRSEAQSNDTKAELGFYTVTGSSTSEAMRINQYGNVGIGTNDPSRNLTIGDGSGNSVLAIVAATNGLSQIGLGDSDDDNYGQIILRHSDGLLQIQNGGGGGISERGLNITSSEDIGIGTTNPVKKLDVRGQLAISNSASSYWYLDRNDSTGYFEIFDDGNVNRLTIDTSGNVGIGVTPWVSTLPNTVIDINPVASIWGYVNSVYLNSNAYYNNGWLYKSTAAAGILQVDGDILRWRAAASGTADAGIAFDVSFIVDSGGNVGIGTISPDAKLDVEDTVTYQIMAKYNATNYTEYGYFGLNVVGGGNPYLFKLQGTERMRITSGGVVSVTGGVEVTTGFTAIGGTPYLTLKDSFGAGAALAEYKIRVYNGDFAIIDVEASNTTRMLITDTGVVDIVGTVKSGGNQRFGAGPAHGNSSSPGITTKANTTNGIYWSGTSGIGGWGGGNFTTNNSDRNMKTNIVPMDIDALKIIDSLETKYFNWTEKANRGDTSIRKAGIIAQDLRELMPEGVYGTEWDDDDENTNGLSLDENATTALLIKAIQELKAEIEILKNK